MPATANSYSSIERRLFFQAPLLIIAGLAATEWLLPGYSSRIAAFPLLLSLFVVGMPHGAVDLAVHQRLASTRGFIRSLRSFAGYTFVLAVSLACFLAAPNLALLLFLVLSGLHFGFADARDLEKRVNATSKTTTTVAALVRGGLLVSLLFAFWPAAAGNVFAQVVELTGSSSDVWRSATIGTVAAGIVTLAVIGHAWLTVRRVVERQTQIALVEFLETVVLILAFWLLHPLFAIGAYVLFWHSWRHLRVLSALFDGSSSRRTLKQCFQSVVQLHVRSLPLLIPTIAVLGMIAVLRPDTRTLDGLAALTIATFAVVTLPHHLLIERLHHGCQHEQRTTEPLRSNPIAVGTLIPGGTHE